MGTKWSEVLRQKAGDLSRELIGIRRQIHRRPELGFKEEETSRLICTKLKELGIKFREGVGKTGVVGMIEGMGEGKTVGLRADMDALPLQEESDIPYSSENPGLMHACGHDAHVACLIGAARLLVSLKDQFRGKIQLVFQPAEKTSLGANRRFGL